MSSDGTATPVREAIIPPALVNGVPMLKISSKKIKQVIVRLEELAITWASGTGNKVPISDIRELRLNQPPTDEYPSTRWITVVYVRQSQWKVLHITALTDDTYQLWVDTLTKLVSETSDRLINQITPSDPDLMWIRQLWPAGAKVVDFGTAAALCGGMGLIIPSHVAEKYNKAPLDLSAFRHLIREAQTRPELSELFMALTRSETMSRDQVDAFLRHIQKLDPSDIFDTFKRDDVWTLDSLTEFLLSPQNVQVKAQDMTRPLPEYFISSSHNTYLVGEQWRGESTVEGYIRVLLAKCRCVEIDCHDGDDEPEVFHKKTLTSKCPVREICHAINKYAFVTSPYPVIISAEVHCSSEQQERLGAILRGVFGEKLVTAPLPGCVGLPSPEDLKYRILFKAKPPTHEKEKKPELSSTDTSSTESDSGFARLAKRLSISNSDKPQFATCLSDLLIYTAGVKYQGFSKLVEYLPHQQFSVSERTGLRIMKENKADWIKHNFNHITRVYPKGFRLNSTNYDPLPYWSTGSQLVALNWQTLDDGVILNNALFADSDGYVLQPLALRQKTYEPIERFRIRIQLISAQRLPLSSDLFVDTRLSTDPSIAPQPTQRTSTIRGKALNPVWNEMVEYQIDTTASLLDLTFVHLEIRNKSLLAQWVKSIGAAPRGYHHLPLYDPLCSRYVFATLFVKIEVDVVREEDKQLTSPPYMRHRSSSSSSSMSSIMASKVLSRP